MPHNVPNFRVCARNRMSALLLRLALLLSALLFASSTQAAHYQATYTGGSSLLDTNIFPDSATTSGVTGGAAGHITACTGPATVTFTWTKDSPNDAQLSPSSVIVEEDASATAFYFAPFGSGSATASDGLDDPAQVTITYPFPGATFYTVVSSGTHYTIKNDPGSCFSMPACNLSAAASEIPANSSVSISYKASITPVTVTLSGTTPDTNGNLNILIGQGCTATLTVGPFTLTNFAWNVSGKTFASFDVASDESWGHETIVPFSEFSKPNPHWYWKNDETVTVTGTATASISNQTIGSVTGIDAVFVWAPYYYFGDKPGPTSFFTDYSGVHAGANDGVNYGMTFYGKVRTPDMFVQANGGEFGIWQFTQLCNIDHNVGYYVGLGTSNFGTKGEMMLDNGFCYSNENGPRPADQLSTDPYNKITVTDSPTLDFNDGADAFEINDVFNMYQLYRPPGSDTQWVSLYHQGWAWSASGHRGVASPWVLDFGWVSNGVGENYREHPLWTHKYTNTEE